MPGTAVPAAPASALLRLGESRALRNVGLAVAALLFVGLTVGVHLFEPMTHMESDDFHSAGAITTPVELFLNPRTTGWVHQPLNPAVLKSLMVLFPGADVHGLRVFYLLVGLLSLLVFHRIATLALRDSVAVTAVTLLYAVHPLVVTYSARTQAYGLLLLIVGAHVLFFLSYLRTGRMRDLRLALLFFVVGFFTHYNVTPLAFIEAFLLLVWKERRAFYHYLFGVIPFVFGWLALMIAAFDMERNWRSIAAANHVYPLDTALPEAVAAAMKAMWPTPLAILSAALLVATLGYLLLRRSRERVFVALSLGGTVAHLAYVFWFSTLYDWTYNFARYGAVHLTFYLLGIGWLLRALLRARLPGRLGPIAAAGIVALTAAGATQQALVRNLPDYDAMKADLARLVQPGDGLFFGIPFWIGPVAHHALDVPASEVGTRFTDGDEYKDYHGLLHFAGMDVPIYQLWYFPQESRDGEPARIRQRILRVVDAVDLTTDVQTLWSVVPEDDLFGFRACDFVEWRRQFTEELGADEVARGWHYTIFRMDVREMGRRYRHEAAAAPPGAADE